MKTKTIANFWAVVCFGLGVGTAILVGLGCTEKERARTWGGASTLKVPCGQKLVNITWKETDLWYLTRAMREGEMPETYTFKEDSSYGVNEGAVTVIECKKLPAVDEKGRA